MRAPGRLLPTKDTILSDFDSIKNYVTDVDYSFTYTDPYVEAETNMDEGRLHTVIFDMTQETAYAFHYFAEE